MALRLLAAPHVLVVDGDSAQRAHAEGLLRGEGARVSGASSGEEALRLVGRTRFDAVVVDYGLPGAGGVVLVAQMRGFGNGRDLPAVVVAGLPGPALERARAHAARLPRTGFLAKPVTAHGLGLALHELLAPI